MILLFCFTRHSTRGNFIGFYFYMVVGLDGGVFRFLFGGRGRKLKRGGGGGGGVWCYVTQGAAITLKFHTKPPILPPVNNDSTNLHRKVGMEVDNL